jgi:hypothetical protein
VLRPEIRCIMHLVTFYEDNMSPISPKNFHLSFLPWIPEAIVDRHQFRKLTDLVGTSASLCYSM